MIGRTISHYKILSKLGEGGMGVVYKAEDTKLKRTVAMKFLPQELTRDKGAKERFIHEAQAAAVLDHTNICAVYEIDENDEGQMFIAMGYYEGETLKDKIEKGPLKIEEALKIAIQVSEGLQEAHENEIVHRDIKSANIMVTEKGIAKILDFGLAKLKGQSKLTKAGTTLGTVAYMSPEQAMGKEVDHRTDIWSLGVILYEMIIGQLPFKGEYEQAILYSIMNEQAESVTGLRAGVPMELESIINKALVKKPEERYQGTADLLVDLKTIGKNIKLGISSVLTSDIKPKPSIAVLPFTDMSPQKDQEYFCDGMAEELINALTKIEGMQVASRTSAFQFKGTGFDIQEIGKKLKVLIVLEGSIRKAGNKLRITAQLVNVSDGYHLWSEKYDRDMEDIFAIQDEISLAIVDNLKVKLLGVEKTKLVKRYTENKEAYNLYLKGRYFWNRRSEVGFNKAFGYFQDAIEIDPDYALAYAGLAEYYCMLSIHLAKPEPFIRLGRIAAEKALSIDETLAEAHTALGYIKFSYDWDWLGAERSFKQAILLNPRYATAYNWYAALLGIINRHEEAIRYMTRAQEYDPGSAIINRDLGVIYSWAGDFDKAINHLQFTIDMDPGFSPAYHLMGVVYLWLKKYDSAIGYFKKVRAMTGDFFDIIGSLGYAYAKSGQREAALKELKKLEDLIKNQDTRASEFFLIHSGLGNADQAFEWLDIACKNHEFAVVLLLGCESELWFEDLLPDPRFKEILRRIGFEK